jgi:VWFA-related protein
MTKFVYGWLMIFCLCAAVASAQSGRKVTTPNPTPTPVSVEEQKEAEYSETAPSKPRPAFIPRTRRTDNNNNKSANKQNPKQTSQTAQTLPNDQVTEQSGDGDGEEVVKIDTSLITIPVSVFDRNGLYIPNLTKENFKIFENGKEQEIAYFGTSEKPFTVILLLDTSPSTAYKIEEIQRAAIAFVDQLKSQDSVMVIEFDANVHVLTEATSDRQKIYKAIKRADFGEGTSLYDAVDFSLRKRLSAVAGRKAIVLFTDGVDTTSGKASYDDTLSEAEEADALIFPIYYNTFYDNNRRNGGVLSSPFPFPGSGGTIYSRGTTSAEYALGKKYLNDLADISGGKVFRPEATDGGLTAAFEGIAEELRRQYNIGYYPTETGEVGQRKQIKVRVNRPNLIVRSRDSYIVGDAKNTAQTQTTSKFLSN